MENKENKKDTLSLGPAIIVAGLLIAGAIVFTRTPAQGAKMANLPNIQTAGVSVTKDDHIRGAKNPKVTIIEYSDIECPFCKSFHKELIKLVNAYPNDVAWVYRHFPLESLHEKAFKESVATECAGEQGEEKFWKYLDEVFVRTNSNDSLDLAELPKIAESLNLDMKKWNACMESGKFDDRINNSINEAVLAGAEGTPYSVIVTDEGKSVVVRGMRSFEDLSQFVKTIIEK